MIFSKTRITRALIRLRVRTGWSAPMLFANPEDRYSRDKAQIMLLNMLTTSGLLIVIKYNMVLPFSESLYSLLAVFFVAHFDSSHNYLNCSEDL